MKTKRFLICTTGLLFTILFSILLGYHQITPTKVPKAYNEKIITLDEVKEKPANFSMTMSHLYQMTKAPHPSGSKEIEKIQSYLKEQLDKIGCSYEIQEFPISMSRDVQKYQQKYGFDISYATSDIINLKNFLVKIDAKNTDKGIMFVSHYDSTNGGPGAADDQIGVASMLETVREVMTQGTLKNDMYFLFTDGEEIGLYGAKDFVKKNPNFKDKIELVVNLEARGNSGTLLMFETSDNNKAIGKALNNGLDHLSAFSFTAAIYKLMPNDTDLSVFLKEGYAGVNFAMLDGSETYHKMTDNYENINRDSSYMYFKTSTDLATYLSTIDLNTLKSNEDAVYFQFLKGNTVLFSNTFVISLSLITCIASIIWLFILLKRKSFILKNLLKPFIVTISSIAGSAIIGFLGSFIISKVSSHMEPLERIKASNIMLSIILILVILGILLAMHFSFKNHTNKQPLILTIIFVLVILNIVSLTLLSGVLYIFAIPLLILLIYSIVLFYLEQKNKSTTIFSFVFIVISTIILGLIYTPVIYILYIALFSKLFAAYMVLTGIAVLPIAVIFSSIKSKH